MTPLKKKVVEFERILDDFPEVIYAGDPILRQKAVKVSIEEGIELGNKLGEILLRFRKAVGYGRGFAAPQIGERKAVFVTFVDNHLRTFINPIITKRSQETNFYRELCLSSGIMAADTKRSEWIIMEWVDIYGKKHREKFDGFQARLYQHEEAHLRGILNLDQAAKGGIEFATFDPLKEQLRKTQ
jgi:peptide deformylase